jgi:hypothetical protein
LVDFKEFLGWYRGETDNLSKVGQKKRAALLKKLRDDLALDEIDDVMGGFIPLWKQDDPNRVRAKEMFDQFDVDKNGNIDEAEFADMCLLLGLAWKKKRIAKEFEKIDTDNSRTPFLSSGRRNFLRRMVQVVEGYPQTNQQGCSEQLIRGPG